MGDTILRAMCSAKLKSIPPAGSRPKHPRRVSTHNINKITVKSKPRKNSRLTPPDVILLENLIKKYRYYPAIGTVVKRKNKSKSR